MTSVQATDLLIAPPGIPDARFKDAVLMLTHDHQRGSFGLCVNKPTRFTLDQVLGDSDIMVINPPALPVYWGGPVSTRSLWMLHSTDWVCSSTTMITSAWAMTSSEEMFHCLAESDAPKYFRIVMGYCSWAPGQLTNELEGMGSWKKNHSWLVAHNLGPEWLFDQDPDDVWANCTTLCSHQAVDSWL